MASTYSPNLRLELITTGEQSGTWGTTTNTNLGTLLEQAIGGYESVAITTGDNTLTTQNGSTDQSRNAVLRLSGSLTGTTTVNCGLIEKVYIVQNDATGSVTFRANSSDTGVSLPSGGRKLLYCNGTNVFDAVSDLPTGATVSGVAVVTLTATQTLTNKTLTSPVITNGGTLTLPTSTDTLVGRATTDTLTNKTLTAPVIATISNTGTLTLPTSTDTLVGRATTDTLTNKTLTAPKFADLGFIADANGNELIVMDTVASAVNELKVANAATGGSPSIVAQGGDTDVNLTLTAKGAGTVNTTSVASFTAGTVLLPSITPSGDPNTGIWFPAGDTISFATNGTEDFRFGSSGQFGIAGANYGTSGQVMTSGGASAAPSWSDAIEAGTSIATTSGTAHEFLSIPSWVRRITVLFDSVSTNGTSRVLVQIGSGSFSTSGYGSSSGNVYGSGDNQTAATYSSAGFVIEATAATARRTGSMTICRITGNTWVSSHSIGEALSGVDPGNCSGGGRIALAGTLDRVRITTVNGTDTFDNGAVNILYE